MPDFLSDRCLPALPVVSLIDFYRSVEDALGRIIAEIDVLSHKADADVVVARLLQEFDVVTRLSAWTDPLHIN
jgi:hypothetical protein